MAEQDEYEHKYTEPSLNDSNHIEEEDIFSNELLPDIIDDLDPSISDIEHSKTPSKKHPYRKKSKSSTNVLSHINIKHNNINSIKNNLKHSFQKETKYIRQRRHSESSSESHSNDYHRNNKQKHNKLPILIPLKVNGKITKTINNSNNNKKTTSKTSTPKSITRSILSRYKSVKLQSKKKHQNDDCKSNNLGISGPLNVQHIIHVEWDDERKAYKGIPDVWHSKIPQSYTVPTRELPVNFRETRSISLTQSVLHRAKSISTTNNMNIINHQPINNNNKKQINIINVNDEKIDYLSCDDSLIMPVPGPRVFINSLKNKKKMNCNNEIMNNIRGEDNEIICIRDYLSKIGIHDLDTPYSIKEIRREFYIKMGFSQRDYITSAIPRHIQQLILTYLDIKSYLRACITCSDLASFLDDPIIWKIQVLYKSKVQGTLHKTNFRLRHRIWKATYMSMVKIDINPSYYDYVWNIVVVGDIKSGQNRLVVSLGKHWRCKLTGLEPVISAVNGTYRFGVDFVIRRVIIKDIIIKLQVWDGGNVMADTSLLKSVNIFLILFDLTKKNSFQRTQNIARSMITLLPNVTNENLNDDKIKLIMIGNTTNKPKNRVISYQSAKRFANERGLIYIEANTDNNIQSINNAFVNLAQECLTFEEKKQKQQKLLQQQKDNNNCSIQ